MVANKNDDKSSRRDKASSKEKAPDPDLYSGVGEFTLPNGDTYAGDYCAHRSGLIWREGHGIYQTQDGQTYEGMWHDDKLVEGKEVLITYPNGAKYCGALLKNKYHGPGTYILESNMNLSCEFVANKPTGMITLVDREGILWRGMAKEHSALLIPENIFYLNLTEDRGKGLSKQPLSFEGMYPSSSTVTNENKEEELSDREWEKVIFAKSKLTTHDIDFADCKWWKNYEEFKQKYDEIKKKIDDEISLDKDDYVWMERFKKYKRSQQTKRDRKKLKFKKQEQRVLALNEKFRSKDFNESCPPVNVIYSRQTWESTDNTRISTAELWQEGRGLESEQLTIADENLIIVGSDGNLVDSPINKADMEAQVIKIASTHAASPATSSTSTDNQMVQFNELVKSSAQRSPRSDTESKLGHSKLYKSLFAIDDCGEMELHFTSFRQEMLLDRRMESKKREIPPDRRSKGSTKSEQEGKAKRDSMYESRGRKSETGVRSVGEVNKKGSRAQLSLDAPKDKRAEKVQECVREFLEQRQEKVVEKRREAIPKKEAVHTHNVGVHTESLTGIPRELLLKK